MSVTTSKILVPIGFSDQSMVALGQAFNLAKIKKSEIVLLSVIEEQNMMESLFLDDNSHELQKEVNNTFSSKRLYTFNCDNRNTALVNDYNKALEDLDSLYNYLNNNCIYSLLYMF